MSTIHLVGGEKGGVGKSVFARLLSQWFIDHSVKLSALDADRSQGALMRSYPQHCQMVDLSVFASADQIINAALEPNCEVVVDLPAQSLDHLGRWLQAGGVVAASAELDVRLVFWHVTDGGFDSVNCLERAQLLLGPSVRVTAVCNRGRSPDFSQLEASAPFQTLIAQGGSKIELPALDSQIMYKTQGLATSLAVALSESQGERALTQMQRRRASTWLALAYSELGPALRELSPLDRDEASVLAAAAMIQPEPEVGPAAPELAVEPEGIAAEPVHAVPEPDVAAKEPVDAAAESTPVVQPTSVQPTSVQPTSAHVDDQAEPAAVAEASTELVKVRSGGKLKPASVPAGSILTDGALTWTEVLDDSRVHHVRYR